MKKRIAALVFTFVLIATGLSPLVAYAEDEVQWQDFNGKKIGVLTGTPLEAVGEEFFPDSELLYFNSYPDCSAALLSGTIDAYLADEPSAKMTHYEQPKINYIPERFTENNYAFAFRKNDEESAALCREFNAFLEGIMSDGTIKEIEDTWFGKDESKKVVDMSDLTGENGTLTVATTSTDMPWSFMKDNKNVGYDIDIVTRFCRENGYALKIMDVDFAGRIPALESGKCDFTTDMNVTPEREEEVLFSEPTADGGVVLVAKSEDLGNDGVYKSLAELDGKMIGVQQGSFHDTIVEEALPDAKLSYYNSIIDLYNALENGKVDAFAMGEPIVRVMMLEKHDLTYVKEGLDEVGCGLIFPKTEEGAELRKQVSEFIRQCKEDGTLEELDSIWFGDDESKKVIADYADFPAENGTLTYATEVETVPFCYEAKGEPTGFEIDLVTRFCKEYGYGLKLEIMNFDGVIPSVQSGRCDFGGSCLAYTEERAQSVDFSEDYYASRTVLAVLKETQEHGGFLTSVKDSFEKTFIREGRYKLFFSGVGITLLITVLSIVFGTALGFAVYMAVRNGNRVANAIAELFSWIIQGLPVVVLLMILYYIIFARTDMGGVAVSVIAFSLVFGAGVLGMLKSATGAVDPGQNEAAYALGYSDRRAFFRIILPQALPHFLPAYKGEVVALLKATAIVGYIAVQDLTKMGDIVRGRTYEAFFPLIAVAVIYFILEGILIFAVNRIEININPRRRNREKILKGVRADD